MLFVSDYIRTAFNLADKGQELGGRQGAALIRLACNYLSYAANGLAPMPVSLNDNGDAGVLAHSAPAMN